MTPEMAARMVEIHMVTGFWYAWIIPAGFLVLAGISVAMADEGLVRVLVGAVGVSTAAFVHLCGQHHLILARYWAGEDVVARMMSTDRHMELVTNVAGTLIVALVVALTYSALKQGRELMDRAERVAAERIETKEGP